MGFSVAAKRVLPLRQWFMEDSAIPEAANTTLEPTEQKFGDRRAGNL